MLRALIRFSLNYSALVVVAAVVLVGYAVYQLPRMAIDVFPELNAPTVTIITEAGGYAADEVEQYISFPIESAVNGMDGVRRVRSSSSLGLSIVWVDLQWGADIYRARQLVGERLVIAREQLPEGVEPGMSPISSVAGEIMLISLSSPDGSVSPLELRSYAEFDLRNRILAVPGVAQAVAIGGELPEYQVHYDQEVLRSYGLRGEDLIRAAQNAHSTDGAGYLADIEHLEVPLRQASRAQSAEDIGETTVLMHGSRPLTIAEVATVGVGAAPRRGAASEGGERAVVLSIQKSPGTNTLALTEALDALFDSIEGVMPEGIVLNRDVVRQSHFITRSVSNLTKVLLEAVAIVVVVLVLFLMNLRSTVITLTALPISLAIGVLVMDWMGLGLNVMTLGGLTVAIGVLVDDAIIDVENVLRRLKQNEALPEGDRLGRAEVIFSASNEIRPAMVFATVIIVMVFTPLLFLQGLEGRFFMPLALTYMISIAASLLAALTVTPALCKLLLRGRVMKAGSDGEGFVTRFIKGLYRPVLDWAMRFRVSVLGVSGLCAVACLWLASTFGTSFLPSFNEGTFTVFLMAPPGTSLVESDRLAQQVEGKLLAIDGVRSVSRRTGRAERDEHAEPVSNSEIEVTMLEGSDRAAIRREIDAILGAIPGITTMVGQPIEHRLSHVLSGTPAEIAISIFGDDLSVLRQTAKEVATALEAIPGTREVNANREVMTTSLAVNYRAPELAAAGLTRASASAQLRTAISGEVVDRINVGAKQIDLVVRMNPEDRERFDQIRDIMLYGEDGAIVRLRDVADIGPQRMSNLITRENARRKAVVSLNVAEGYNLGDLMQEVSAATTPIVERAGYTVSYGGQFEAQQEAAQTITVAGAVVAIGMLLLLQVSTGSLRSALLVMLNMPLALIGGILAIAIASEAGLIGTLRGAIFGGVGSSPVISIASLVGFITLFGIAVRNGILLVNHYNHLIRNEGCTVAEAVAKGSEERLVPILMTAVSAALGLLPLALAAGQPGSELLAPLAIVTLGGLTSSTVLNLIVIPAGFSLVFSRHRPSTSKTDTQL